MKLTRIQAYTLMESIKHLKDYNFNVKTTYTLIKNLKKIEEEFKISVEIRDGLLSNLRDVYALKTYDGSFESDSNIFGIKIREDKLDDALKEHLEYTDHLNEKINFNIDSIDLSDLEGLNIEKDILSSLDMMIND